jgi:hypothetical protein
LTDWLRRIISFAMDQHFARNDTGDERARDLHDGSVMGAWQAQIYGPLR